MSFCAMIDTSGCGRVVPRCSQSIRHLLCVLYSRQCIQPSLRHPPMSCCLPSTHPDLRWWSWCHYCFIVIQTVGNTRHLCWTYDQSNLAKIALNSPCSCRGESRPPSNTTFLEPQRVFIPNRTLIRLAIFASKSARQTHSVTDTRIINYNSSHVMHSVQPNNFLKSHWKYLSLTNVCVVIIFLSFCCWYLAPIFKTS